jgi:hypothetical protein
MNDQIENLKALWQESRSTDAVEPANSGRIIAVAKEKIKRTVRMQLTTIFILTLTLAILCAYFIFGVPLQVTVSRIGAFLMTGVLAVRILIEIYSIGLARKVDLAATARKSNHTALIYHRFRGVVNGPVTIAILLLYSAGFYMLTPAFTVIFPTPLLILIDVSYLFIALLFIGFIRNTIKKERRILDQLLQIQEELNEPTE